MVNSSSAYNYSNYDNPEYYGQTESPQLTARDLLPGYGTSDSPPPSVINKEQPASTIANILATQRAYGAENQDQRAFVKTLDNPNESAYHQANLTKEPIIIAPQRSATSLAQAQEEFNALQDKVQQEREQNVSLPDEWTGDKTIQINPIDAHTIGGVLPTSKSILSNTEINPLGESAPPKFSSGTEKFRADTAATLANLEQAKSAGMTSLDIFDSKGNKIGTTNPQDIVRARYDIMNASLASGGPVKAVGNSNITGIESTQTTYERANDNPLKAGLASLVEPGAYIGLSVADLPNVISQTISGKNAYKVGQSEQQKIQTQIEKSIGPTYLDQMLQGNFSPENSSTPTKIASLIGSGVGLYLTGGGGIGRGAASKVGTVLRNVPQIISDLPRGIATNKGLVSKIASGIQEGSLISKVGPVEGATGEVTKGSPLMEFTQGTAGKSGIESFVPEKAEPFAEVVGPREVVKSVEPMTGQTIEELGQVKTGMGKLEKVTPGLPDYLSETKEVTGVGREGKPQTFTQPNEIKLDTGLEGQAKVASALINPKDTTLLVRSEPNDVLPPNKLLVEFQGLSPIEAAGQAVHYGLEEVPGMKNVYFGEATPHNIELIGGGMKAGAIKLGTDIFGYGSRDFGLAPDVYGEVTRSPELFKTPEFAKGGKFEGITRPNVIRYLVGGVGKKVKTPKIGRNQLVRTNRFRPFSGGQFGLNDIGVGKVGAGAAGRAMSLLKENSDLTKVLTNVKINPGVTKARYDYLGPVTSSEERRVRGRVKGGDLELQTIVYPKIVDVNPLSRTRSRAGRETGLVSNVGLDEVSKLMQRTSASSMINLNKLVNIGAGSKERNDQRLNQIVIPRLDLGVGQQQRSRQDQITIPIDVPITTTITQKITRMGGPSLLGGGLSFPWGYYFGNKKRKVDRFATSFFTYSVNPNVVGAIAQAGLPGKVSGPSLSSVGRFRGMNYKDLLRTISIGSNKSRRGSNKLGLGDLGLDLNLDFGF